MKTFFKTLATGTVVTAALVSGQAYAGGVTANIGATSNYLWRGITQTDDGAAISGGLDYTHDSGFYLGTWTSNVKFGPDTGYELDLYGGFKNTIGDFGYDIGVLRYNYPKEGMHNLDTNELYLGGSYGIFSAKYSYTDDWFGAKKSAHYIEGAVAYEISKDLVLGAHVGVADGDAFARSVADYNVSLTKGEFTLTVSDMNHNKDMGQSDNARVVVSWKKTFDL